MDYEEKKIKYIFESLPLLLITSILGDIDCSTSTGSCCAALDVQIKKFGPSLQTPGLLLIVASDGVACAVDTSRQQSVPNTRC